MAGRIDVNQLTSILSKLQPDSALQQYAAMHKNDPYIVSLAASESNRRKELRAAGQAMQGMQPQPKVADAAIAQMAPQEPVMMMAQGGIAALPAANMQHMADGGIAGYADGDLIAHSEPVARMAEGGIARYKEQGLVEGTSYSDAPAAIVAAGIPIAAYRQATDLASRMGTSVSGILKQMGFDLAKTGARGVAGATRLAASAPGAGILAGGIPASQFATDVMAGSPELREAYTENPMLSAMDPNGGLAAAILSEARPGGEKKIKQASPSEAAKASNESGMDRRMQAGSMPSIESISSSARKKDSGKANIKPAPTPVAAAPAAAADPAKEGIAALFKPSTAEELGAEAEKLSKKDIERMNKEYSPFLEELKAEKEAIGKRKESNVGEALLRAGLGMMGGKSQYAMQNIAEGAKEGLSAYNEAQKADEAARRALRQSEMSMMQAQRAERTGYHKDAIALLGNARQEKQFAVSSAQKAEEIKNTEAFQKGSLANQRIVAEASRLRASGAGGNAEDKHTALLLKVQTALQNNPMYKAAAEAAAMFPSPSKRGDAARAAMKHYEETTYRRFAPELLQSGQASPAGAGSGLDMSQWGKSQVVKP